MNGDPTHEGKEKKKRTKSEREETPANGQGGPMPPAGGRAVAGEADAAALGREGVNGRGGEVPRVPRVPRAIARPPPPPLPVHSHLRRELRREFRAVHTLLFSPAFVSCSPYIPDLQATGSQGEGIGLAPFTLHPSSFTPFLAPPSSP